MSINGIPPSENDVVEVYLNSIKKLVAEMSTKIVKLETGYADWQLDKDIMLKEMRALIKVVEQQRNCYLPIQDQYKQLDNAAASAKRLIHELVS